MEAEKEQLEALKDIRQLMQKSSRFISLSGLAGVFSGIYALLGAAAAHWRVNLEPWAQREQLGGFGLGSIISANADTVGFLILDGLIVLVLSIATSLFFTRQKAKRTGQPMWGAYSRQLLLNIAVPLVTGAAFCSFLFYYGLIGLIAPATLIFYGLALVSSGKFTLEEVSYLGMAEILLGLLSMFKLGFGLVFWGIGFGVLHIVYGILMYIRYDR